MAQSAPSGRPTAPDSSISPDVPAIAPNQRANYLLNQLEHATVQDGDSHVQTNVPTMSKAAPRGMKLDQPSSSTRLPSPTRPRYGPSAFAPSPVKIEDDSPTSDQVREERRRVNDDRLEQVTGMWRHVSLPPPDAPIIILESIDSAVLDLLRKGRAFARLALTMEINPPAKKSRQLARKSGRPFDGFRNEFAEAVNSYNLGIIRLRGIACAANPNYGAEISDIPTRR